MLPTSPPDKAALNRPAIRRDDSATLQARLGAEAIVRAAGAFRRRRGAAHPPSGLMAPSEPFTPDPARPL